MLVYTFVLPIGNSVNNICEKLTTSLPEDIQNKWISLLTNKKWLAKMYPQEMVTSVGVWK